MIAADQPTIFDSSKVTAFLSSKQDGNTKASTENLAAVEANIKAIAEGAGLAFDAIAAMNVGSNQEQWDEIVTVTSKPPHALVGPDERIVSDALVTNVPGIVLLLPVADCNAVAIHDPEHQVLALVHLGWQSTVAELATKVVEHLQRKYQVSAADLRVYFSPAIKADSYVFDSVKQTGDPAWKPFLRQSQKGIGVDLPGYNRQRFIDAGVLPEHIQVSSVDTATSPDYFTHYRSVRSGEPEGRFALLVKLK